MYLIQPVAVALQPRKQMASSCTGTLPAKEREEEKKLGIDMQHAPPKGKKWLERATAGGKSIRKDGTALVTCPGTAHWVRHMLSQMHDSRMNLLGEDDVVRKRKTRKTWREKEWRRWTTRLGGVEVEASTAVELARTFAKFANPFMVGGIQRTVQDSVLLVVGRCSYRIIVPNLRSPKGQYAAFLVSSSTYFGRDSSRWRLRRVRDL